MTYQDARVAHARGALDSRFAKVADAFAKNFEEELELGAAFAVLIDGALVVDITGGHADKKREAPWSRETIACIFSSGKAALALLIAREASEGRLDYGEKVGAYWPAFAQNGKEDITVAQVLSHQAGLCGFVDEAPPQIWIDWDAVTARLETMAPLWPRGAANGYHPQTFGFLAGELIRRTSGRSVGAHLRALTRERGLQLFCGMREEEMTRAAMMPKPPRAPDLGVLNEYTKAAFLKPWSAAGRVDRATWMAAEIPASNMHGDARALASLLYPVANDGLWPDGERYLTREAVDAALEERVRGDDLVLPFHLSWSAGLMRNINRHFGPNENAFGHSGFGGSCVVIDPENRLTAAYVMSKMSPHLVGDPRALQLLDAAYDCL